MPKIWGIHGGKTGEAEALFLRQGYVAMGWGEMGDLAKLAPTREAFKEALAATYPEKSAAGVANNAGQLYRFVHELKSGDHVAFSAKLDRQIHLGVVEGDYRYDAHGEAGYPHRRKVKWLKALPRTAFSQGALYELGSAMSFFLVKSHADELAAKLAGPIAAAVPAPELEEDAALTADAIEQITGDFVLKQLALQLKGHALAEFVAHLMQHMGYQTRVSPVGPDGGIDIIAHKDLLGFEPPIIKVQVKSSETTVGDPVVTALYGKVGPQEFGLFVTLGNFSNQARVFAREKSNLRLIDGAELVELVMQFYEKLDSKYKGIIPLKRVYVQQGGAEE